MKKYPWLLCGLLLCACSGKPTPPTSIPKKSSATKQTLEVKNASLVNTMGDGNEDGFYHLKTRETKDGNTMTNITYYDYATRQEVYLCDKPECHHSDDTCTSYLNIIPYTGVLFTHGDGLYLINNETIENVSDAPSILKMDLDGKNRKKLASLHDGYRFDDSSFAISGSTLYHGVVKESLINAGSYSLTTQTDKQLYAIDLESGDMKKETSLRDKKIIGAKGHNLIFAHNNYERDPDELLKNKDFEAYDQVTRDAKMGYILYDITTKKEGIEVMSDSAILASGSKDNLYYLDDHLYAIDITSGKTRVVTELPSDKQYVLGYLFDDTAILEEFSLGNTAQFLRTYAVSLTDGVMTPLPMKMKNPDEAVKILGFTTDQLLIQYDRDGHMEKSWAGTDQFRVDHEYVGLILKKDFFAGKDEIQDIRTLE